MTYYTDYTLKVHNDEQNGEKYHKKKIEDCFGGKFNLDISWSEHEKDMIKYSKKHPEVTFELIGEGQEREDMWKKFFTNGKVEVHRAEIQYIVEGEDKERQVLKRWVILKRNGIIPIIKKPFKNNDQASVELIKNLKLQFPGASIFLVELFYGNELHVQAADQVIYLDEVAKETK